MLHRFAAPTSVLAFALASISSFSGIASAQQPAPDAGTPATPVTPPAGEAPPTGEAQPGAAAQPGEATPGTPPAQQGPRAIVIDAAPYGVDPVVGRFVTDQMRRTAGEMGYSVLTRDETVAAAQRLRMPFPPTPADLWRVTYAASAQRGAFARVWAYAGRYVVEITVASIDGRGPFFARGTASAQQLTGEVDRLFRQALPPPAAGPGQASQPGQPAQPGQPGQPGATATATGASAAAATATGTQRRRHRRRRRINRFSAAVQTEAAFGASQDFFYNHLLGARLDFHVSREVAFGAYAGYANLRGKDGRVSNILMYLQLEDRVRVSSGSDLRVPLRLGVGYLPYNGAVVRLAAGLSYPLSRSLEIVFDILTPTFWVLPDRTVVSLNLAVELGFKL